MTGVKAEGNKELFIITGSDWNHKLQLSTLQEQNLLASGSGQVWKLKINGTLLQFYVSDIHSVSVTIK